MSLIEKNAPRNGDYVQLLDADNKPSENFAHVDRWTAYTDWLNEEYYQVLTEQGEAFNVVRLSGLDTDERQAWQQFIPIKPFPQQN